MRWKCAYAFFMQLSTHQDMTMCFGWFFPVWSRFKTWLQTGGNAARAPIARRLFRCRPGTSYTRKTDFSEPRTCPRQRTSRHRELIRRGPEAFAGKEAVLHPCPRQLLQIAIGQVIIDRGAGVFVSDFNAADAFIVGGEGDGHVGGAIDGKRMHFALDAEDSLVRA